MSKSTSAASAAKARMPRSIPYIIGNEAAERFSFYGMKAILTTYLATAFFHSASNPAALANEKTHLFISLTYLTPLIGGIIADWFLGKYKVILYVSLSYCLGHACLALFENDVNGFMLGLLLIALGAGGIKPCVSANVGDQFDKSNNHLIPKAFDVFYFSINFGSFFSTMLIPVLLKYYGPALAFGIPGILMGIATFIFWLGRKKYVKVPPSGFRKEEFYNINFYCLRNSIKSEKEYLIKNPFILMSPIVAGFVAFIIAIIINSELINNPFVILLPISGMVIFFLIIAISSVKKRMNGENFYDIALRRYSAEQVSAVKSVWRVLAVFAFIPFFWALYDQNGSEWVLQAAHPMMNLTCFGVTWLPEQIQSINPILILVFIPLFSMVIYPAIEKIGIKVTPMRKIGTGLVLTALSFVIIYLIQVRLDAGQPVNIIWQLWAYVVITMAEILISITGLEYAYTQAPKTMKSTIMSFWLLMVSIGNILVTLINNNKASNGFFARYEGANYYALFIGIILFITLIFILVSKNFTERSYLIDDTDQKIEQ